MFLILNCLLSLLLLECHVNSFSTSGCDPLILTPYIESKRLDEARKLSAVQNLPKAPKVTGYAGFLTKSKETAPLLLWLNGGPGTSSMFGIFNENGPYSVDENITVTPRNYSWIQEFSVLYVDNPVGTGFSFTHDKNGLSRNQSVIADNLYEVLQQFFTLFSEYRRNDFYITGESYAGKYIPAIGYKLHTVRNVSKINFKGVAIGNGWIDPINMLDYGTYLKNIGFIDENQATHFYYLQNKTASQILKESYQNAYNISVEMLGGDDTSVSSYFENITGHDYIYNFLTTEYPEELNYYSKYLDLNETRYAIHVGCLPYTENNLTVYGYLTEDIFKTVKPWFTTLINNYKVLLYSGNLDIIVAPSLTENFLANLEWKHSKEFSISERVVWKVSKEDKEVAGYTKHYAKFTQVIVRNAGHAVPFDQPRASLDMITRFINSQTFKQLN